MARAIDKILLFRRDISPFVVHLTRGDPATGQTARDRLNRILTTGRLEQSGRPISDARFGINLMRAFPNAAERAAFEREFFASISFTETPLGEMHNLLEIEYRGVNLEPYGLLFLKEKLAARGLEPAVYLNNIGGDKDALLRPLAEWARANPGEARKLLPLLAIFGKKVTPPDAAEQNEFVDFRWEREWRYSAYRGDLTFDATADVFVGLCPDEEIGDFEARYNWPKFVDPRRNMKWYAEKLIEARQHHDLKHSVV